MCDFNNLFTKTKLTWFELYITYTISFVSATLINHSHRYRYALAEKFGHCVDWRLVLRSVNWTDEHTDHFWDFIDQKNFFTHTKDVEYLICNVDRMKVLREVGNLINNRIYQNSIELASLYRISTKMEFVRLKLLSDEVLEFYFKNGLIADIDLNEFESFNDLKTQILEDDMSKVVLGRRRRLWLQNFSL